ncbi:MAG: nucleotidyltransferase domain-containing protein, partial [Elusimicrobiota bacterium]
VLDLIRRKSRGEELDDGPRIPRINAFLTEEIARLNSMLAQEPPVNTRDWDALDVVFRESLREVWGSG